jgi:endogenous inhibitor of DNA gyrase (YacG/DUF329 family)
MATRKGCPICGRPPAPARAPFCSAACADRDLANWMTGRYAIPARGAADDDDAAPGPAPARERDE